MGKEALKAGKFDNQLCQRGGGEMEFHAARGQLVVAKRIQKMSAFMTGKSKRQGGALAHVLLKSRENATDGSVNFRSLLNMAAGWGGRKEGVGKTSGFSSYDSFGGNW